jgi:hypothetical protein
MILLLKYYFNKNTITTSSIIIFFSLMGVLGYIYLPLAICLVVIDVYLFIILKNFRFEKNKCKDSSCKIEIVAEGQELSKTDDLAKMLLEYDSKLNS